MRVALVHDWLVTMGGAERVLEEIAKMYPDAPIYTGVVDRTKLSPYLKTRQIIPTMVQRWPQATLLYNRYLPLLMYGFEQLDLSHYDLVISSSAAVAKGVVTRAETLHVSYVHTPMRYAWDLYHDYRRLEARGLSRKLMGPVFHYVRLWDRVATDRVDVLIANSRTVQARIQKHYRRPAVVIHPPVAVSRYACTEPLGDYYLVLSRLVSYKRIDLAIDACNSLRIPLWVAGDGPERARLERRAGPTIRFLGSVAESDLAPLMARAKALLFPGEEDFGIVPVEIQAAGRPVIALDRGGVRDTVIPERTGILFPEQTVEALMQAVQRSESRIWDAEAIRQHAQQFNPDRFREQFLSVVNQALVQHRESIGFI